jgi:predicted branched-subunit amino acid permease
MSPLCDDLDDVVGLFLTFVFLVLVDLAVSGRTRMVVLRVRLVVVLLAVVVFAKDLAGRAEVVAVVAGVERSCWRLAESRIEGGAR